MRPSDLPIGTTFGSYTVCGPAVSTGSDRYWPCRCVCSVERLVKGGNLKSGRSNSCGCQAGKRISQRAAARSGRPRKPRVEAPRNQDGVHGSHCCTCGCKYGDKDCPVITGRIEGILCEDCETPVSAPVPPLRILTPKIQLASAMRRSGARWSEILDVTGLTREEVEG